MILEHIDEDHFYNKLVDQPSVCIDLRETEKYKEFSLRICYNINSQVLGDENSLERYLKEIGNKNRLELTLGYIMVIDHEPNSEKTNKFASAVEKEWNKIKKVYSLSCAFQNFVEKYRPFCDSKKVLCERLGVTLYEDCTPFDWRYWTQRILPHLFLGDYMSASSLESLDFLKIDYIVNASNFFESKFKETKNYFMVDIEDFGSCVISTYFEGTIEFIEKAKQEGKCCLVHW